MSEKWPLNSEVDAFSREIRRRVVMEPGKDHLLDQMLLQVVEQAFKSGWQLGHNLYPDPEPPVIELDTASGFPHFTYRHR